MILRLCLLTTWLVAACASPLGTTDHSEGVRIAIIADTQYADRDDNGTRYYRGAPLKLSEAVDKLNREKPIAVFHLGDFIDRDWQSFERVESIVAQLDAPLYHVLGNHDFEVGDDLKRAVPPRLGLDKRYYVREIGDWRFVVLDGNDLSTYAWPTGSEEDQASKRIREEKFPDKPTWNGGLSSQQLAWLEAQLSLADQELADVILLSHFPVFPEDSHNLWNAEDVLSLVTSHPSVKAWFNGHNHLGNYGSYDDVHFVTFKGLVDEHETAFAVVDLSSQEIVINGFGREPSRVLRVRQRLGRDR